MIQNPPIEELRYVNGMPDPNLRPDQARMAFVKNGEPTTGASGDTVSDGVLNRPSVQIQANVTTVHNNVKSQQTTLIEVVDAVNELTGGGDANLGSRVAQNETDIGNLNTRTSTIESRIGQDGTIQGQTKTGIYLEIDTNRLNIGVRPTADVKNPFLGSNSIRDDNWYIKSQIIGNKRNYDPNGNFNDTQYPAASGMQAELERNTSDISQNVFTLNAHDDRITFLEDNSNVGDVSDLREDIGERTLPDYSPIPIFTRLGTLESNGTQFSLDLQALSDIVSAPTTGLVDRVTANEVTISTHTNNIATNTNGIQNIVNDVGTWTTATGTLRFNIEANKSQIDGIWSVLGTSAWATENSTVRYRLNKRELELGVKATDTVAEDTVWGYVNRFLKGTATGSITDLNTQVGLLNSSIDTTSLTGLTDNSNLLTSLQEIINRIIALEP